MAKILTVHDIQSIIPLIRKRVQKLVIVGGCFDVLHIGHIIFLQEAKKMGDILLVLLESDQKVRKIKGPNRPLFTQKERALVLSSLAPVDFVVLLPMMKIDKDYSDIVDKLKPQIIAVTEHDPMITIKKLQAETTGGTVKVVPHVKTFSSSKLAQLLGIE